MKQTFKHMLLVLASVCVTKINAQVTRPVYNILKNDPGEIHVRIQLPEVAKKSVNIDGQTYYQVEMPDATAILEKGAPALVGYGGSFAIPKNAIASVSIISTKYTDERQVLIAPSKGNLIRTVNPNEVPYEFGKWYKEDKFYPAKVAQLEEQYDLRQIHGQRFTLNALQYNAVSKILRHYNEIEISIKLKSISNKQLNFISNAFENADEFFSIYNNQFLNFSNSGYERALASNEVRERGSMLILCYQPFMSAMQPFVNWKRQNGLNVILTDVATAGTTPEAIKAYIGNMYATKKIAYVLLVGDAPQIPPMKLKSGPSDVAYSYQVGNDRYPDLIIGRFSAETIDHVKTQVDRSINYERNFVSNSSWRLNGICIGSDQGPGDNNEFDWEHERKIRSLLMNYKYAAVSELYDGTQNGGVDKQGNPKNTDLSIEINNGAGIINYTGHGGPTSFGTTGFNNTDIQALTNYDKLPFIISVACVNGEFDRVGGPCFAETWLRSTKDGKNTGAVATIMSTINQSWDPPMYGQDEMDSILAESFKTNIKRTFGGVTFNGLVKMNDRYGKAGMEMTDTWTIFGDPSLLVSSPKSINNSLADEQSSSSVTSNFSATILPNPVSSVMHLKIENTNQLSATIVNIYTHNGQFIKSIKLNAGINIAHIPVSDLKDGLYYVDLLQNNQKLQLNLSVQH